MPGPTERPENIVLIVDDNEDNLQLLQAIFDSAGFRTLKASSVAAAEAVLSKGPPEVDLVLSDISMPGETGFDLLRWIRDPINQVHQIPVLLITAALPEDVHRIMGLSMGAVDYIVRPINNQELVLRVKNALEHFKQFRSLQRSLENSEDMATTGRILAASNHEIRNIVGLIHICAEQALGSAGRDESMSPGTSGFQSLSSLSKMTKMLTDIAKDPHSYIHTERIRTSSCSVRDIIDNMLSLTEQKLRGIQIDRSFVSDQYYVRADATRVLQILLNVSLNALDAIEEKGARSKGRLEIKVTESSHDTLQIRVSDNGIGLVTAAKKIEFQPFETTKAVKGGKGLGLWLCSRLANAMEGSIFLESKGPGFGTTAVLELKRATPNRDTDLNINEYFID